MVRKVAPKKAAAPKKVSGGRRMASDELPKPPKSYVGKFLAIPDDEWWSRPPRNQVPDMKLGMGKVSPKWVPAGKRTAVEGVGKVGRGGGMRVGLRRGFGER